MIGMSNFEFNNCKKHTKVVFSYYQITYEVK